MDEIKFVDIHAHMSDSAFASDIDELAPKFSNYIVLNAGEYPEENDRILALGKNYPNILPCVGVHPNFISRYGIIRGEEGVRYMLNNIQKFFAVSEVGLDFNKKNEEQITWQKKAFSEVLETAEKSGKVCIVHSRKAMDIMLDMISSFRVKVVLHCFEGNAKQHMRALDMGAFISVSTIVMKYKRDKFLRRLNPDQFFVETDSPVLSPDDQRNTPLNIPKLLSYIAEVRKTDAETLKEKIYDNFRKVFAIDSMH